MAADAWTFYESATERFYNGTNAWTDAASMALFQSTSNAATASETDYSGLTNEVANANGYTTGGITMTMSSATHSGGTTTLDSSTTPVWTASGGSIVARFAVIYYTGNSDLVCYTTLDNTPADVTATTGNTLTVTINGSGIATIQ